MSQLVKLHIEGFRSIRDSTLELRPLNVLIGANGAGKSNLIDFFRMLNYAVSRGLQSPYLTDRGPASQILHFGPKQTPVISGELTFLAERGTNSYQFSLAHVRLDDSLLFTHEEVRFHDANQEGMAQSIPVGPGGHRESGLSEQWAADHPTVRFLRRLVQRCRVYQFHDTSETSFMRGKPFVDDCRYLRANGGNLAAVIYRLKNESPDIYQELLRNLQTVLPWFADFVLEPEGPAGRQVIPLRWRMEKHGDYDFVAGQLSDGSLRILALVTLLLLPETMRADVVIIDEPELGLHPVAENVVSNLIKQASRTCQVILATQSASFLDHFRPDDVVVTEIEDGQTKFRQLSEPALRGWLERYTLSQIWSKNVFGARP